MNNELESKLTELVQNELVKRNCELFSLRVYRSGNRQVISLAVDHATGGITLDECVRINHWLSDAIEQSNLIPAAYTVEVQSPGLDWPLQAERDYRRMIGKRIRIEFGVESGVKSRTGRIEDVRDSVVYLKPSPQEAPVEIALSSILNAKPDFQV